MRLMEKEWIMTQEELENLKNEHAQALGRLKAGKKEIPSVKKSDSSRNNVQKARDTRRRNALLKLAKEQKPYTEEELRAKPKPFLFNEIIAIHEKTIRKMKAKAEIDSKNESTGSS